MFDKLHNDGPIDPRRLLEAADVLLEAEAANERGMGLVEVLERDPAHPRRDQFTARELIEAMSFLIRAGLVQPREASATATKRRRSR